MEKLDFGKVNIFDLIVGKNGDVAWEISDGHNPEYTCFDNDHVPFSNILGDNKSVWGCTVYNDLAGQYQLLNWHAIEVGDKWLIELLDDDKNATPLNEHEFVHSIVATRINMFLEQLIRIIQCKEIVE